MAVVLLAPVAPLAGVAAYKMEKRRRVQKALKTSAQSFFGGAPPDQKGVRFGTWDARTRQFQVNPEFRSAFGNDVAGPVDMLTPDEAHMLRKQQMQKLSLPPRFRNGGGTVAAGYGSMVAHDAYGSVAPGCGYDTSCYTGQGYSSPVCAPSPLTACTSNTSCAPAAYSTHSYAAPQALAPTSSANAFINTRAVASPLTSPVVGAGAAYNDADIYSH